MEICLYFKCRADYYVCYIYLLHVEYIVHTQIDIVICVINFTIRFPYVLGIINKRLYYSSAGIVLSPFTCVLKFILNYLNAL